MNDKAKALDSSFQTDVTSEDGNLVITAYQDVEPHLEYAAKVRRADAEERGAFGKRPDLHRTMTLPFNIIMKVAGELGIAPSRVFDTENQRRIYAVLKGPDYKRFRTTTDKRI